MGQDTYAVVTYLPSELRQFVDSLRKRLNPKFADWLPHVTILPPRSLSDGAISKMELLQQFSPLLEPIEAKIEGVSTFWPANGVVYLSLSEGFRQLIQLHDVLNVSGLAYNEAYPYVPHITVAQELDEAGVRTVLAEVSAAWKEYPGPAKFRIEWLSLVQQVNAKEWLDLTPVPLGNNHTHACASSFPNK